MWLLRIKYQRCKKRFDKADKQYAVGRMIKEYQRMQRYCDRLDTIIELLESMPYTM